MEAERLGKKVIYHFLDDKFPSDATAAEPPELSKLQQAYRQRLKDANRLRYAGINSATDLELSIRRITDELAALRRQADRRQRNLLLLVSATVLGTAAVAALVFVAMHRQSNAKDRIVEQGTQITQQGAELKSELDEVRQKLLLAFAPRTLALDGQPPAPLAPERAQQAKLLLEQGNPEDQALAQIALKNYAAADGILQNLQAKPGITSDEQFRLFMLEGDNWHQANEPDKASVAYERAMALKPDDFKARNGVALTHLQARVGNITAHQQRAIEVGNGTLKHASSSSTDWAMTQQLLGSAWTNLPTGDRNQNLLNAIAADHAALTVYTKSSFPDDWAATQNNLGIAWYELPTGDKAGNFRNAIEAYEAALTVYTKEAHPVDWAQTENNLALTRAEAPSDDPNQNIQWAISAYRDVLTVRTRDAYPADWAQTESNLGLALSKLTVGDRAANVRQAIDAYNAVLDVYTSQSFPREWARTQYNLSIAWSVASDGDRGDNLRHSLAASEAAFTVYTHDAFPSEWASTESSVGYVWDQLPTGDRNENHQKAVAGYLASLTVFTREAYPRDWLSISEALAWSQLRFREFTDAQTTATDPLHSDPPFLTLEADRAHALLFLGRTEEALAIYRKYIGANLYGKTWSQAIRDDLNDLANQGVITPQFQRVVQLLGLN